MFRIQDELIFEVHPLILFSAASYICAWYRRKVKYRDDAEYER
jgi:hypothetical protein